MKTAFLLIISTLTILLFDACKNTPPDNYSVDGRWIWVKTTGGIAGVTLTPITEGYDQEIEISKNFEFRVVRDNQIYDEGEFKIVKGKSIYMVGEAELIKTKSKILTPGALVSFAFNADTLFLFEECFDCFNHVYLKKK